MNNITLYFISTFIWGSTWFAIKFRLGAVDPLVSVVYRFMLAAIILLIYCKVSGRNLKFKARDHIFFMLMGILLFGVNYWLVYLAELILHSGVVAIIFSSIIFLNVLNGAIFLGSPVRLSVVIGGVIGILGLILISKQDILSVDLSGQTTIALIFSITAAYSASLGNITSARNQLHKLPVLQTNAFGML